MPVYFFTFIHNHCIGLDLITIWSSDLSKLKFCTDWLGRSSLGLRKFEFKREIKKYTRKLNTEIFMLLHEQYSLAMVEVEYG